MLVLFAVCPKCHASVVNTNGINKGDLNENLKNELKFQKVVQFSFIDLILGRSYQCGSMKNQQVAACCCNIAEGSIFDAKMAAPLLTFTALEQKSARRFLNGKVVEPAKIHHGTKAQYADSCVFMAACLQVD